MSTPRNRFAIPRGPRISPAFRAALRIARRDALRHKARSLLIIALIGLPVLIIAMVDVGWRTYQLGPAQKLDRAIGSANLAARNPGLGPGIIEQTPSGWIGSDGYGGFGTAPPPTHGRPVRTHPTRAALLGALPAGSRVITEHQSQSRLAIRTAAGVQYAPQIGLDYTDPIARGLVTQVSGRAPRTTGEAAITTKLSDETGLTPGDTLTTFGGGSFAVVGLVRDTNNRNDLGVYTLPAAAPIYSASDTTTWLAHTPTPITWAQVLNLNKLGFLALSRGAYLDPPPKSQIPLIEQAAPISRDTIGAVTLVAGLALLELVLLAGPAFAVSARRQRRELALIAATGGRRRDLRNVVLANGIVLGVTAGVLAVAGGIGLTAALLAVFGDRVAAIPGPFDVRPLELAIIALVAVVTAVLATLVPARGAARLDVVAALSGRRGEPRIRRRVPVIGIAVTGLGVAIALFGESTHRNVNLIIAGVAVVEIGLIVLTPTLITLVSKAGRWLPFAPRLALRDATRNRSSAAPAVAAVMAATIGAIAVAIIVTSQTDLDRQYYVPQLPTNTAYVSLNPHDYGAHTPPAAKVAAVLRQHLAPRRIVAVRTFGEPACAYVPFGTRPCRYVNLLENISVAHYRTVRFQGTTAFDVEVLVDDGSAISAMVGMPVPQAVAALRAGKAVVFDKSLLHDGKTTLTASGRHDRRVTVAAVAITTGFVAGVTVLPPSLATSLTGLPPQIEGVLAVLPHPPTDAQRQALNAALLGLAPNVGLTLQTESGFHDSTEWALYALVGAAGVIALGAAAIATLLANVDGRADLVTLGAVGASPRTRRIISMSRAGVIAGLGVVIGVAAGFVPAVAWIRRQVNATEPLYRLGPHLRVVVPWPQIALLALGVPLLAMLVAGAFTRSRLPSERRGG